jgi:MYXO-CTERM domain-containing protein
MGRSPSDLADSGVAIEIPRSLAHPRHTATRKPVIVMLYPAASTLHTGSSLLATSGTNPGLAIVIAAALLLAGVALYLGLRRRNQG